jgi:hypothetical protein
MNTAYSTRVVQEGGRRCKKSTLNDLVHLTPLRIPLMNPPYVGETFSSVVYLIFCNAHFRSTRTDRILCLKNKETHYCMRRPTF